MGRISIKYQYFFMEILIFQMLLNIISNFPNGKSFFFLFFVIPERCSHFHAGTLG